MRESATASPTAANMMRISPEAKRTNAPLPPEASAGRVRLRCHQPAAPSSANAAVLASSSRPYAEVNSSAAEVSRATTLNRPDRPTPTKHHSAMEENRAAATSSCACPRSAWAQSTASPPTQSARTTRCTATPVVARSWLGEEAEWPVSAGGSRVARASTSRPPAAPAVIAPRANSASASENSTTRVSAMPWETWPAKLVSSSPPSTSATGRPSASDRLKTIVATAAPAQTRASQEAALT
ncbi:hypothetical protein GCM10018955_49690 [Planomonospora venezuelensis]